MALLQVEGFGISAFPLFFLQCLYFPVSLNSDVKIVGPLRSFCLPVSVHRIQIFYINYTALSL